MPPDTHSRISASTTERWWHCPGSVREVLKCPPQPPSVYAKEGTAAHFMAESCLRTGKAPFEFVGEEYDGVRLNEEMAEAVQVYLDVIDEDLRLNGLKRSDLLIEKKFHLTSIDKDAWGTSDAVLPVFLTKAIVYDFKYGSGVAVDADDNKQGLYYCLGASELGDYEELEIVIVQPRAIHKAGPIRRWSVSKKDLDKFGAELKSCIDLTKKPDAPLCCGEWCKKTFCPALPMCPEARRDMQNATLMAFDGPVTVEPKKPEELTSAQLKKLLDMAPIIDAYLKAVEDYALNQANNGKPVLGYKLVSKRSNRKWKEEEAVVKKFGKVAIRVIEEVLSPSQLETELKKSMKAKEAKAVVEPLTFKPDTGSVLVPESDPREAIQPRIEGAFNNESEDLFG